LHGGRYQPGTNKARLGTALLTWAFAVERVTGIEPALSAWELACHASPTTVFAAQNPIRLSVSARYGPSQTVASGTQRARPLSPRVHGYHLIRSDLRSQRLPGRSPIDLPECCSPVRGRRQL
jgi:hypothetical protein